MFDKLRHSKIKFFSTLIRHARLKIFSKQVSNQAAFKLRVRRSSKIRGINPYLFLYNRSLTKKVSTVYTKHLYALNRKGKSKVTYFYKNNTFKTLLISKTSIYF